MFNHSVSKCFKAMSAAVSLFSWMLHLPKFAQTAQRLPSLSRFPSCLESMTVHKAALAKCSAAADSGDAAHCCTCPSNMVLSCHNISSHVIKCQTIMSQVRLLDSSGHLQFWELRVRVRNDMKRQCPIGNLPWRPASVGSETLTGLPNSSFIQSRMRLTSSPSVGQSSCHFDSQWMSVGSSTCHWIHMDPLRSSSKVSISSILLPIIVLAEKSWQIWSVGLAVSNIADREFAKPSLSHNQVSCAPSPSRRKCQSNSSVMQGGRALIVFHQLYSGTDKFWRLLVTTRRCWLANFN